MPDALASVSQHLKVVYLNVEDPTILTLNSQDDNLHIVRQRPSKPMGGSIHGWQAVCTAG
ncbi:hypothetical protein WOLCODRAFT_156638 [Wolfiporia cocos MD-104 SS10]|uniref:Uncharacterized protein n=1 Tax=Wolfiporia cocos (strain MD-104) TaxID=742152 RepID=A0A2H3JIU8_WOLCO|nr:hypothetical protein WOLCODRAFT_156638 [Wolfiporia cocos MD-104 SS10]